MAFGTRAYPKPGRSTNLNRLLIKKKFNDCVRPGVEEVRARPRTESRELIKLDFPTFERPMKAISGNSPIGQSDAWKLLFRNSALGIFILQPDARTRSGWQANDAFNLMMQTDCLSAPWSCPQAGASLRWLPPGILPPARRASRRISSSALSLR